MCDIPTVPLHCLSGIMSDSVSERRTKRREKSREGNELIKSRRKLNIGKEVEVWGVGRNSACGQSCSGGRVCLHLGCVG